MLRELKVHNFKKHDRLAVTLDPGLNFIVGPNYSGKTSLMESILFALGGPACVPGGSEVAFKRGTKNTGVTVEFDGFTLSRSRSGASMDEEAGSVATGKTAVNERIAARLGMSIKDLLKISYMRQGSASQLATDLGAQEVNRLVEAISGITDVDGMLKVISTKLSEVTGALSMIKIDPEKVSELEKSEKKLDRLAQQTESNLDGLSIQKEATATTLRELSQLLELHRSLGNARLRCEAERGHYQEAEKRLKTLQEKDVIPVTPEEVEQAKEVLAIAQRNVNRQEAELREVQTHADRLDGAKDRVSEAQTLVTALENRMSGHQSDLLELEQEKLDAEEAAADMLAEMNDFRHKIRQLQVSLSAGSCPECGRAYEDDWDPKAAEAEKLDLEGELERITPKQEDKVRERDEFRLAIRKIETKKLELGQAIGRRDQYVKELDLLEHLVLPDITPEKLQEQRELADGIRSDMWQKEQGAKLWKAHTYEVSQETKTLDRYQSGLKELVTDLGERLTVVEPKLEALGFDLDTSIAELQQVTNNMETEAKQSAEDYWATSRELTQVKAELTAVSKELKDLSSARAKLEALTTRDDHLKRLRRFLVDHRARYLDGVWAGVLAYTSEVCRITTGGSISEVRRERGEFYYVEDDELMPIEAASGSMKTLIGAGLKLALTKSLPAGLNILLMDEPTSDCDEQHSSALMRFLAGADIQTLVITHKELDMAVGGNVIQLGAA